MRGLHDSPLPACSWSRQFWALELRAQEEAKGQSFQQAQWLEWDFRLVLVGREPLWLLFVFSPQDNLLPSAYWPGFLALPPLPDPSLFQDSDFRAMGLFYSKHYENVAGKDPSSLRPGGEWILTQGVAAHFPLSLLLPGYLA